MIRDRSGLTESGALARCFTALSAPLVIGTLGFWWLEPKWDLWDSLYFTLVTVTTVGYGDRGLSVTGERFAAVVLVCGIGVYTYALSTLVQIAVQTKSRWERKMEQKIKALSEHVVVCGYGRMGRSICQKLDQSTIQYVVVEWVEDLVDEAIEDGRLAVRGVASEDHVLVEAGVERARAVVCGVDSDAENIFITMSVREHNPTAFIVTRCESPSAVTKLRRAGASLVVSPHEMAGSYVSNAIVRPQLTELLDDGAAEPALRLSEVAIADGSRLEGQTVASFGRQEPSIAFVALRQQGAELVLRPAAETVFGAGDILMIASDAQSLERIEDAAAARRTRAGRAVLA